VTAEHPNRIGRYRIVSEIGRGAMGVVYRGEDEALGRAVAIKTIIASMDPDEQAGYLARFRQEAKALGGLNHPGIITVHEFGDQDGLAYLAMELLEGRELRDVMNAGVIRLPAAVDLAAQLAEGLAYAHAKGIVHRDVKPANVMVLAGDRAKLMDFGIARVRASDVKTQTGMMLGSPKYMSPEQVMGRPLDHRSDIFSLGVILHEMLAGAAPFSGEDVHQLMFQVCSARPAPPSAANPAVPRTLDLIVARALEKEPEARYPDAAAMAADLRAALAELGAGAPGVERAPASGQHEATLAQPRPAAAERTQALGAATLAASVAGLHVSARFDSGLALLRLAEPRGRDRKLMSPVIGPPSIVRHFRDPQAWAAAGMICAALAVAWWIGG
jgi:serine/threonine protein kinase